MFEYMAGFASCAVCIAVVEWWKARPTKPRIPTAADDYFNPCGDGCTIPHRSDAIPDKFEPELEEELIAVRDEADADRFLRRYHYAQGRGHSKLEANPPDDGVQLSASARAIATTGKDELCATDEELSLPADQDAEFFHELHNVGRYADSKTGAAQIIYTARQRKARSRAGKGVE